MNFPGVPPHPTQNKIGTELALNANTTKHLGGGAAVMDVQNFSMNRNPEETERMLRQLGVKIQKIADRVKRIGSYSLSMELSEIASNLEKICLESFLSDADEIDLRGLRENLAFLQEVNTTELSNHVQ
jgi:hypothetical protein